ncbi:putative ribonuclease P protein subunit 3 [Dictyocoela muelleri]|nr:putative ribonuclease P protein subunit 3 [Dictyocoela muelleri]
MYDLNISRDFKDFNHLEEYDGIAITHKIETSSNIEKTIFPIKTRQYHRFEYILDHTNINFNYKNIKCDIFSITPIDDKSLEIAINWSPDIITITKPFKLSLIREIVNQNIFIEVKIRDGLYNKVQWLRTFTNILRVTKKNILISSGAVRFTELKKSFDIIKMLNIFKISDDQGKIIVYDNPRRCLLQCAIKRFSYNGVVSDIYEGELKDDFLKKKFHGGNFDNK